MFVDAGVDKIRLTGGEPTIREDLGHLVKEMKTFPGDLKNCYGWNVLHELKRSAW